MVSHLVCSPNSTGCARSSWKVEDIRRREVRTGVPCGKEGLWDPRIVREGFEQTWQIVRIMDDFPLNIDVDQSIVTGESVTVFSEWWITWLTKHPHSFSLFFQQHKATIEEGFNDGESDGKDHDVLRQNLAAKLPPGTQSTVHQRERTIAAWKFKCWRGYRVVRWRDKRCMKRREMREVRREPSLHWNHLIWCKNFPKISRLYVRILWSLLLCHRVKSPLSSCCPEMREEAGAKRRSREIKIRRCGKSFQTSQTSLLRLLQESGSVSWRFFSSHNILVLCLAMKQAFIPVGYVTPHLLTGLLRSERWFSSACAVLWVSFVPLTPFCTTATTAGIVNNDHPDDYSWGFFR